jgi:hypothetical protein
VAIKLAQPFAAARLKQSVDRHTAILERRLLIIKRLIRKGEFRFANRRSSSRVVRLWDARALNAICPSNRHGIQAIADSGSQFSLIFERLYSFLISASNYRA